MASLNKIGSVCYCLFVSAYRGEKKVCLIIFLRYVWILIDIKTLYISDNIFNESEHIL